MLGGCKCPIAPPLATLLVDVLVFETGDKLALSFDEIREQKVMVVRFKSVINKIWCGTFQNQTALHYHRLWFVATCCFIFTAVSCSFEVNTLVCAHVTKCSDFAIRLISDIHAIKMYVYKRSLGQKVTSTFLMEHHTQLHHYKQQYDAPA